MKKLLISTALGLGIAVSGCATKKEVLNPKEPRPISARVKKFYKPKKVRKTLCVDKSPGSAKSLKEWEAGCEKGTIERDQQDTNTQCSRCLREPY